MKVLIADDEPVARRVLREHLEDIRGVVVVGEAATGLDVVERVGQLRPDVVLLDLEMPALDGFAAARRLQGGGPAIVFVTAHDNRALDAFQIGAADYLLKPVRRERLEQALERARRQLPVKPPAAPLWRKFAGRIGSDYHMIDTSDIVAFRADGELVHLVTAKGRYTADATLKAIQERLPTPPFRRIHRSTIINTDHVRKISPLSSKRWLLRMSSGLEVVVSKRLAGEIRQQTGW